MATVEIEEEELRALLNERVHLRQQVSDLQSAGTSLVELRREGDPTYCVAAFHNLFSYPVRTVPTVDIPDEEITLRARLTTEEYFETIEGFYGPLAQMKEAEQTVMYIIRHAVPMPDLVKIADGTTDSDYISEGTRLYFGIPRLPVWKEVQRSNMAKTGGVFRADGKILKPPGWTPPDIAGVLRAHGWRG